MHPPSPVWSMSSRYASYWNAFLFTFAVEKTINANCSIKQRIIRNQMEPVVNFIKVFIILWSIFILPLESGRYSVNSILCLFPAPLVDPPIIKGLEILIRVIISLTNFHSTVEPIRESSHPSPSAENKRGLLSYQLYLHLYIILYLKGRVLYTKLCQSHSNMVSETGLYAVISSQISSRFTVELLI